MKDKMKGKFKYVLVIVITLIISVSGTIFGLRYFGYLDSKKVENKVTNISLNESDTIKSAIDKVYNSSVYIETYINSRVSGSGSGFVYKIDDKFGYILTNFHVIDGASKVEVTNVNGQTVTAKVLGGDEYTDLAVLRIDKSSVLLSAELKESDSSNIGDTVFTVGSPMGKTYMGTVTKGIISGKNRSVTVGLTSGGNYVMEVLQVDAALNPGNSGGPLVNINGEVIGVTSMKLVENEVEGMGFAIPTEVVETVLNKLENDTAIQRPYLGVGLLDVNNSYALYSNDIKLDSSIKTGAVVAEIDGNSPAATSGFQKGDVILEIEGKKVSTVAYFRSMLYKYSVGDTVTIKIYRNNEIKEIEVKLDKALENS